MDAGAYLDHPQDDGGRLAAAARYPTNQTVGFWYRRMAHETLVHRIDAELAAGYASPVDQNLALDGIDEMLVAFLAGPWWEAEPEATLLT